MADTSSCDEGPDHEHPNGLAAPAIVRDVSPMEQSLRSDGGAADCGNLSRFHDSVENTPALWKEADRVSGSMSMSNGCPLPPPPLHALPPVSTVYRRVTMSRDEAHRRVAAIRKQKEMQHHQQQQQQQPQQRPQQLPKNTGPPPPPPQQ
jgi:hypothetical protein